MTRNFFDSSVDLLGRRPILLNVRSTTGITRLRGSLVGKDGKEKGDKRETEHGHVGGFAFGLSLILLGRKCELGCSFFFKNFNWCARRALSLGKCFTPHHS